MARQVSKGELMDAAGIDDVDEKSYSELREMVGVNECKQCHREYIHTSFEGYCSDTCQVEYINENF